MVKTLLVEDDVATRRLIESVLQSRGHAVTACGDAESAWEIYQRDPHPLVVLDWLLPGMDGLELCRRMRLSPAGAQSVIVVSTGRDQAQDLTAVLDAGADDYLTKPFGMEELLARIRVALRHSARVGAHNPNAAFSSGPLTVDLDLRRVTVADREVKLTPIEFKLLSVLVKHAGKVVTHRQLLSEVWGPRAADETQYLRVYMTHLRRKLDPGPEHGRVFETEAGVGYRLCWEPD